MHQPLEALTADKALGEVSVRLDPRALGVSCPEDSKAAERQNRALLQLEERQIAARHVADPAKMWPYTLFALGCFSIWIALFPLTIMGLVPLWAGFVFATLFASTCYLPSHEAMHHNIGRPGTRYHVWNELVGQVSTIILIFPYSMTRLLHLEHHRHCNHPEHDPDFADEAPNWWKAWIKTWLNRQPGPDGSMHHYKRCLERIDTPAAKAALRDTTLLQLGSMTFMFGLCWSGHAFVAAFLFWLPRHIGLSYIRYWLSWAPHHPRDGLGRYENTRVFKTRAGHWLSLGMQYHLVHHLYPAIPNHATRQAYEEMKPVLEKRGVDCSAH